jgi:hypothetical protein
VAIKNQSFVAWYKSCFSPFCNTSEIASTEWIERLGKWSQHQQIYHSELCAKITACQSTYCIAFQVWRITIRLAARQDLTTKTWGPRSGCANETEAKLFSRLSKHREFVSRKAKQQIYFRCEKKETKQNDGEQCSETQRSEKKQSETKRNET